jgi:type II secretion system protein G
MPRRARAASEKGRKKMRRGGFTLVEVLVVIAIISVLMGLVLPSLMKAGSRAKITETKALIVRLKAALQAYEHDHGDYPPTSLQDLGFYSNSTNDGIESLVVHLASKSKGAPYLDLEEKRYENLDRDNIPNSYPLNWFFGDRQAREIVDSWGSPLVYFHHRDYASPKSHMRTYKTATRKSATGFKPGKSKRTATYHNWASFQLWSVGPNGKNENGDGDDITSWGK